MKIDFRKVPSLKKDITFNIDDIKFIGTLEKKSRDLAKLEGKIYGKCELLCDSCGKEFDKLIDEKLSLKIFNGIIPLEVENDLDIIEVDEIIDFDEILFGEIESIKLDYNYCEKCNKI